MTKGFSTKLSNIKTLVFDENDMNFGLKKDMSVTDLSGFKSEKVSLPDFDDIKLEIEESKEKKENKIKKVEKEDDVQKDVINNAFEDLGL